MDKYKQFIDSAKGGIFSRSGRERLAGVKRPFGPGQSKNSFWFKRRNDIKSAFMDLAAFFSVANPENIQQVATLENIKPFIDALFWTDLDDPETKILDSQKAKLAVLLISVSIAFLREGNPIYELYLDDKKFKETIDLAHYLAANFDRDVVKFEIIDVSDEELKK